MDNRVQTTTQSAFGVKRKKQIKAVKDKLQVQQMNPGQQQYEGKTERPWGP